MSKKLVKLTFSLSISEKGEPGAKKFLLFGKMQLKNGTSVI